MKSLGANVYYQRVRQMAHERVKATLASGYKLLVETGWSRPDLQACCAIGAIAYDGEQPQVPQVPRCGVGHPTAYLMASRQLAKLEIPKRFWSGILDGIQTGFERKRQNSSANFFYPYARDAFPGPAYDCLDYTKFYLLGLEIRKMYAANLRENPWE